MQWLRRVATAKRGIRSALMMSQSHSVLIDRRVHAQGIKSSVVPSRDTMVIALIFAARVSLSVVDDVVIEVL